MEAICVRQMYVLYAMAVCTYEGLVSGVVRCFDRNSRNHVSFISLVIVHETNIFSTLTTARSSKITGTLRYRYVTRTVTRTKSPT